MVPFPATLQVMQAVHYCTSLYNTLKWSTLLPLLFYTYYIFSGEGGGVRGFLFLSDVMNAENDRVYGFGLRVVFFSACGSYVCHSDILLSGIHQQNLLFRQKSKGSDDSGVGLSRLLIPPLLVALGQTTQDLRKSTVLGTHLGPSKFWGKGSHYPTEPYQTEAEYGGSY